MPRIGLFWKIFGSYLGLVLASALLVGLLASGPASEQSALEADRFLRSKLALLEAYYRRAAREGATENLAADLRALPEDLGVRFTVVEAGGRVVADSHDDARDMENHAHRPELLAARQTGTGSARRFSNTVGEHMMYVARRVDGEDGVIGYVRVARPEEDIAAFSKRLRGSILGAAVLAVGIGLLLAWFAARRFVAPIRSITEAASAIAGGGEARRVRIDSSDELGELASAFEAMSSQLQERIDTISTERRELRAILSGMVEGVVAVDAAGTIVLMNAAASDMLGIEPDAAAGRSLWEGIPLRPVAEVIANTLQNQRLEESEIRVAETPHDRVLQLYAAPLQPAEGRAGAVLVVHDITELRRLERVRRDFVANASHELKTPVAAIHGLVETILEDDSMDVRTQAAFLERIQRQTGRLSDLIAEMLKLSRLEAAEGGETPRERLDLRDAVRGALETVNPMAGERRVAVHTELPGTPAVVHGSGEALQRIVVNLLENAVKFTREGGAVEVRVASEDGHVLLEVEDQGPGIPVADRARIFERFYRVDRGRSRDVGGTGLGLAIVKHLVHGLGGDVGVAEAKAHAGSVFRVRFPLASA